MARYVLSEAIDACKIIACRGSGVSHWDLVCHDGRTGRVHHDWIRDNQPVVVGDYLMFDDNHQADFSVPCKVFERLFSLPVRKIASAG